MTDTVLIALLGFFGVLLVALIPAVITLLLNRRLQPHQIAQLDADASESEAAARKSKADKDALDVTTYEHLYAMYKEMSFDMVKIMEEQRKSKREVTEMTEVLAAVTKRAVTAEQRADNAEAKVKELEQRIKDYPQNLLRLEKIITRLEEKITQLEAAAKTVADTNLASAQARQDTAATALIAAQAPPAQPPSLENDAQADAANTQVGVSPPALIEIVEKPTEKKEE